MNILACLSFGCLRKSLVVRLELELLLLAVGCWLSLLLVKPRTLASNLLSVHLSVLAFVSFFLISLILSEHEPGGAIWRAPGEECTEAALLHSADWVADKYCRKNRWIMSIDFQEGSGEHSIVCAMDASTKCTGKGILDIC